MMLEVWWKAFIVAIIIAVGAKILGCNWNIFLLFAVSFIAAAVGLILLVAVSDTVWSWFQNWRKKK